MPAEKAKHLDRPIPCQTCGNFPEFHAGRQHPYVARLESLTEAAASVGITQSDDAEGIGSVREEATAPADPLTVGEAYGPLGELLEYEQARGIDHRQLPYPKVVTGELHVLDDQPRNRQVSIDGFHAEVSDTMMPTVH